MESGLHTVLTSCPASAVECPDLPQLAPPPPAHHTRYAARWKGTISSTGSVASAPLRASPRLFSAKGDNVFSPFYTYKVEKMPHSESYCVEQKAKWKCCWSLLGENMQFCLP